MLFRSLRTGAKLGGSASDSIAIVRPKYKSLEHNSTVVACRNDSEMFYVLKWCERMGKKVSRWMYDRNEFPFCVSVNGDIVGWTDQMDRALYYKPFEEYVNDIEA